MHRSALFGIMNHRKKPMATVTVQARKVMNMMVAFAQCIAE